MDSIRYQELENMLINEQINNLSQEEIDDIKKELSSKNHNLKYWENQDLPSLAVHFFTERKYVENGGIIENFVSNYNGTDINNLESQFLDYCTEENVYKEEFILWKDSFRMFLRENKTFSSGWIRSFLLDVDANKLKSIPDFPFLIEEL